jgi:acyl carrier protein
MEMPLQRFSQPIRDFILGKFLLGEDPLELTDRTPLISGGILDSISTLKRIAFLEEHFGIRIEAYEAHVEHLDTIEQLSALVAAKKLVA